MMRKSGCQRNTSKALWRGERKRAQEKERKRQEEGTKRMRGELR